MTGLTPEQQVFVVECALAIVVLAIPWLTALRRKVLSIACTSAHL